MEFAAYGLFHRKQKLNIVLISLVNQSAVCQISFAFRAFFGQNVTFKSMLPLQFTGTG